MTDPTSQQAVRAYQVGQLGRAEHLAREVLARRPKEADALAVLGMVEFERGRYEAALSWHEKAVRSDRRAPGYHCNMAQSLTALGRSAKAMASYERALKLDPGCLEAVAGKADLLERGGRAKRARALVEPLVVSGKATPRIMLIFLRLAQRAGEDVADRIETTLARHDIDERPRRAMLFLLGQAYDRRGDLDRAFDAYTRANEIGARPFDPTAFEREVDDLLRVFSREALAGLARSASDADWPVYVVSLPRSGSTLVEQIIHAHPQAQGAGEVSDLRDLVRQLPASLDTTVPFPDCVSALTTELANELAGRYLEQFRRHGRSALRLVDKNLGNFVRLGLVQLLVPRARVIHARRHPLDLCLSCYFQNLSPVQQPYASDLRSLGLHHRQYDRLMAHWKDVLDLRLLEVDYEDLVADQEAVSRRMIEFLDLPWDDRCLRYHEARRDVATLSYDQVRQPIYATAVKRYERYEKFLGPLREALGG